MSVYQFTPCPDKSTNETLHAWWDGGFSNREIKDIISIGEDYVQSDAVIDGGTVDQSLRKAKVSWLAQNNRTQFIYDKMAYITRMLNGQYFDFDLFGFVEDFQYTVYGPENDHYVWHMDKGATVSSSPRKLSLVLQLSDPSEYEGGDLELMISSNISTLEKKKGIIHAFPSFVVHRVTPVTRGIRRTLVIWVSGPKFR